MISPSETRSLNNTKHNSYVGIPVHDEDATLKAGNGRFMKNGYQDVWASVLFMIGTLGLLVGALVFFIMSREVKNLDFQFDPSLEINFHSFLITLVASSIGTVMFVTVCMLLMRYFPREYLITSNISIILIFIVTAILTYVYGHKQAIPIMVVLLVVALLHAIWFCFAWKRIPLASLLLAFSNRLVFRYNATVLVSILGFFLNLLYLCAGVLCLAAVLALNDASRQSGSQSSALDHDDDGGGNTSPLVIFLITLVVLMWYWGSNVIMNVVHVTVAGVAATVYFLGTCVPSNPTWKSFVRATTTSFGSICLGSLVVAILQLIRYTVRSLMHHRNHVLSICLDCFLGLLENLMEWFNTYAFTYLAIYGESYLNSSKKAWKLIKNAPFGVIFNESLVDNAVLVTALLCTIMANGIVYVSTKSWNLALIASLWTLIISILHLRVITSNVISLFVCVADAPDALQYSEPELHTQINLALQR